MNIPLPDFITQTARLSGSYADRVGGCLIPRSRNRTCIHLHPQTFFQRRRGISFLVSVLNDDG